MRLQTSLRVVALFALALSGCGFNPATIIFPVLEPNPFEAPPVPLGETEFTESRVEFSDAGDGEAGGITLFAPAVQAPRGTLVWVLGLNNRAYFHQSFHEYLASQGWLVVVPDTREFSFTDFTYHRRIVDITKRTYERVAVGELGAPGAVIALGGYSAGGSLAAFASGELRRGEGVLMWAPAAAPFWYGVDPEALLPQVTASSKFILGELDPTAPPSGWPTEMRALMVQSSRDTFIVEGGVHLFFQEPNQVDDRNPFTSLTRDAQMAIAITQSFQFLESLRGDRLISAN